MSDNQAEFQAESVDQAERQGEIIPESETGSRERPHLVRSYKSRWHGDVAEDDEDDREPMASACLCLDFFLADDHSFSLSLRRLGYFANTTETYQSNDLHP
jgi:hypothetical protein